MTHHVECVAILEPSVKGRTFGVRDPADPAPAPRPAPMSSPRPRGSPSGAPLAEVHIEGPGIYDLPLELMAWAAHRLGTGHGRTPVAASPADAFGLDALRQGCADIGLTAAGGESA
ncbi:MULTISPECIES: hypothetical protein [unclassified Streptomyces]|uniref:hypothetical protein n=1 Tax=unclassified Streptomyces TaxID=2593676 RepID=UPI0033A9ACB4